MWREVVLSIEASILVVDAIQFTSFVKLYGGTYYGMPSCGLLAICIRK
jgi:hypothetical protein